MYVTVSAHVDIAPVLMKVVVSRAHAPIGVGPSLGFQLLFRKLRRLLGPWVLHKSMFRRLEVCNRRCAMVGVQFQHA